MSRRLCNYCVFQGIEALAKNAKAEIVKRGTEPVEILVHYPGDKEPTWIARFMRRPEHCVCAGPLRAIDHLRTEPAFICPRCGTISHNPNDLAQRYCAHCHVFVDDPVSA